MSIFAKPTCLLLLLAALAACQSAPETARPLTPQAGAETETVAADGQPPPADDGVAELPGATEAEPELIEVDPAQWMYEEAINALQNGNTDFALDLLLQVSTEAPDKPFIFTNLGLTYLGLERLDEAAEAFAEAISRDGDDAVAHNHLGIIEESATAGGNFEGALEHYRRSLQINGDYAYAHMNLGILFDLYLQDLEQALAHYRRYQELMSEENEQVAGWIVDIERRLN